MGAAVEGLLRILCNVHSGGLHGLDANDFPHTHTHTPQGTIIPSILPHCPFSFPLPPSLTGVVAIEAMGGPPIVWRAGRVDAMDPSTVTPDGRLPEVRVCVSV